MAITDKFVTSFSELYIGDATTQALVASPSDTVVRDFFLPSTLAQSITLSATATFAIMGDGDFASVTDAQGQVAFFKASGVTAALTAGNATTFDEIEALVNLAFFSAKVPLVSEIGTLANEATVIDVPEFGEKFKGKLRGQLDGGQLDSVIFWAPRNYVHIKLREFAENGCPTVVGIKWQPSTEDCGGGASTDSELVVFKSFVSSFSIDTTFDDVAKASTTLVVDGEESFAAGL